MNLETSHCSNFPKSLYLFKEIYLYIESKKEVGNKLKIKNIYDEFYKMSNLTFQKKNNRDLIDYNNVFLTISTQNYIFDMMTMARHHP